MERLYQLEHLVWLGVQTDSPFLPMYKVWLHEELKNICNYN